MQQYEKHIEVKENETVLDISIINQIKEFILSEDPKTKAVKIDPDFLTEETELILVFNKPIKKITVLDGPRSHNPVEIEIKHVNSEPNLVTMVYNTPGKDPFNVVDVKAITLEGNIFYQTLKFRDIIPIMVNDQNLVIGRFYF